MRKLTVIALLTCMSIGVAAAPADAGAWGKIKKAARSVHNHTTKPVYKEVLKPVGKAVADNPVTTGLGVGALVIVGSIMHDNHQRNQQNQQQHGKLPY